MKPFREELLRFQKKLASHEPFALSRFGDGEMVILMGDHPHRARRMPGTDYGYVPGEPGYAAARQVLIDAFRHRADDHYVGICCPHCIGDEDFEWLRRESGQDDEHLTYATVYFYDNYPHYVSEVVPLYAEYEVVLVCSREAELSRLPFRVARDIRVGRNAWVDELARIGEIRRDVERMHGALVLLCAGPFANILAHQLHRIAPQNTYLDLGSSLDPWLFRTEVPTRRYMKPEIMRTESCDWTLLRVSGRRGRPDFFEGSSTSPRLAPR